ncbi:uncharacterized protein RBU57_013903 isoform 2-T5 [Macrochelys suwanniensis]
MPRQWTGEQEQKHRREPGPQGQVSGTGTQQESDLRIFGNRNIFISSEGAGRWQIMTRAFVSMSNPTKTDKNISVGGKIFGNVSPLLLELLP